MFKIHRVSTGHGSLITPITLSMCKFATRKCTHLLSAPTYDLKPNVPQTFAVVIRKSQDKSNDNKTLSGLIF